MSSITTITVGANAQPLSPGPVAGATADNVTIVNLDTAASVNLGSQSSQLNLELGPLASVTLTAPVWAAAVTTDLKIGVLPGGSNYSPGSLTITGPVTATITGTVAVEVQGTADINVTNANINVVGDGGFITPGAYTQLLNDTTGHTLAATPGATYDTAVFDMQLYQSYSVSVQAYCTNQAVANAPLTMPFIISWYADPAGTILLETDMHWFWLGNTAAVATAIPLTGGGAARGAYMQISFYSTSGVAGSKITAITIYGSGRAIAADRFQQPAPLTGINSGVRILNSVNPVYLFSSVAWGWDGIVANETSNSGVPASGSVWLPLPLFEGAVSCRFSVSTALMHDFVLASAAGLQNGQVLPGTAAQGVIWNPGNTAGAEYTANLNLGSAPTYIVLSGTTSIPTFSLQIEGTRS